MKKRKSRQFYTVKNPFLYSPLKSWILHNIPNDIEILEPFAGKNHLIKHYNEIRGNNDNTWVSYDIDPQDDVVVPPEVLYRDTIKDMPKAEAIITNPPYLRKESASINFPSTEYSDLYQLALSKCLESSDIVVAIIPESFLTQGLFLDGLSLWVTTDENLFNDTGFPVGVGCWNKNKETDDFDIYFGNNFLTSYKDLISLRQNKPNTEYEMKFNDVDGNLGLIAIDNTQGDSIRFVHSAEVKDPVASSRSFSRIKINYNVTQGTLDKLNETLKDYRRDTGDLFLTPFKSRRKDGKYRRRLSWKEARLIIDLALSGIAFDFSDLV